MHSEKIMVRKKYLDRIRLYYETDLIKVLVGPRRSGKSMILMTIMDEIEADDRTIEREFGAFSPIKSANPKYVMSLDELDMSKDGIVHYNIIDFLDGEVDLYLT